MTAVEPPYLKYTDIYGIYNEYGELIGISDDALFDVKKAFEEDRLEEEKIRKSEDKAGYLIS